MKKFCFLLLFASMSIFGQTESYVQTLKTFQEYYNQGDSQAIYDMMNSRMQEQLGLKNVKAIVTTFRDNLGSITEYKFISREGFTETYEATFEHGRQNIALTLQPDGIMSGLRFLPAAEENSVAKMDRNQTPLSLPFKGEWYTFWGGDTKAQNYHVVSKTQKHAFDFLILDKNGKSYERSGTRNEDYYAFGKPIYAVCDALLYKVTTGVEDNRPGIMNPTQMLGNSVILKTENEEYIVYAHFEKETVKVKEGDFVKRGQYLGNCGNSGNSTEAHLHIHIQDGPNVLGDIGVKCYFDSLWINGTLERDYSPVKGDKITRPKE
ncbi:peptidoglycan DD-metalloendopeptidase family protein [Aureisphaera galaxeae]|uniref:peptidoglycan DD-metalloendopeptidase family protein n=1 Tax=Aureisphaera galaxeae TaxID=1538023 RepID=UPI00234FFC7E|nr:peptidoglycan DD-metalloendopeptidase family protein [Aureisphaera galaxeae]MDC8004941.1 peptidoglycan DD-metalloendopeptidase family protein [Aureisphaera galaxeae]